MMLMTTMMPMMTMMAMTMSVFMMSVRLVRMEVLTLKVHLWFWLFCWLLFGFWLSFNLETY